MAQLCFYFQVHQPYRVKHYRIFDIGSDHNYFNGAGEDKLNNGKIFRKVADKCYLPANAVMLELLERYPEFKISYSLSGVFMDQMEEFGPDVMESFKRLVKTGRVEILGETYYHSLAFLYSQTEFERQVKLHSARVKKLFNVTPRIFRNTELIYNNNIAHNVEKLGFKGILAEGAERILDWRSPGFVYKPIANGKTKSRLSLLLKNYRLSDDIAFRFSDKTWSEWPLTVEKYVRWLNDAALNGPLINLFMDYETFGEHQWADTGIFDFLKALPNEFLKSPYNKFVTPSEAIKENSPVAELDVPDYVSWADIERDLSAWLSNDIQRDAAAKVYGLEKMVLATKDKQLIEDWRRLLTSDHFYYMSTKWWQDGDVHKYFNPYNSPYEAFIAFINAFNDLKLRAETLSKKGKVKK